MKNRTRLFIFASVVLVIFALFVLVLSALLLSRESVLSESDKIDYTVLATANIKLQNEFKYMTTLKGDNNIPRKIMFSSAEVNALLAMLASSAGMLSTDNIIFSDILLRFDQGIFYFNASKKISFATLLGKYINIRSKFVFDIENSNFKIDIMSFKVGDILLPKFLVDYFLNQKQEDIANIPLIQKLLNAVKDVHVHNDKLVIVYYPKNLQMAVSSVIYGR